MLGIFCRRSVQILVRHQLRCIASSSGKQTTTNRWPLKYMVALLGASGGILTGGMLWERSMHAASTTVEEENSSNQVSEVDGGKEEDGEQNKESKKKKGPGFRDRKVIEYENRIRAYSTPDKIFRYFATLKAAMDNGDVEIYMTPEDFIRSITPDEKQPEGLGLDQFKKIDPQRYKSSKTSGHSWDEDSIFNILGDCGLISFTDYMFLLTVLSTPERHFEIAFRLFDLNGDGDVQVDEFQQVTNVIRAQTATGKRHRDRVTTGNVIGKTSNSSLTTYFFGKDLQKKLTTAEFLAFHRKLRRDLLKLEFNKFDPVDGRIQERCLAKFLIVHANLPQKRRSRMLKRVKKRFADDPEGITFDEMEALQKFLSNVNDINTALSFYHVAGADIDPDTFKHVAKMVGGSDLSQRVVDVIYSLFDENDDGKLSHKELISVMKHRQQRGLDKSKELGLSRIMEAMWKCAKKTKSGYFN
ncbi:calcium uptake protein 1, mitochondrial-like [Apostichopus japonicus]|uniref:calcium uptake protein 1, mitochondrial-like n=1 Tax=Stichopus japonicus TaxID=307972 RepID=UPI003AB48A38